MIVNACSHFENNTSIDSMAEHSSSLVAFRFPTRFEGHTCFRNNKGGGITLLHTILMASGTMLFDGNTAQFGGAIAMDDRCLVCACLLSDSIKHSMNSKLLH